jgi:hypothetical protein
MGQVQALTLYAPREHYRTHNPFVRLHQRPRTSRRAGPANGRRAAHEFIGRDLGKLVRHLPDFCWLPKLGNQFLSRIHALHDAGRINTA